MNNPTGNKAVISRKGVGLGQGYSLLLSIITLHPAKPSPPSKGKWLSFFFQLSNLLLFELSRGQKRRKEDTSGVLNLILSSHLKSPTQRFCPPQMNWRRGHRLGFLRPSRFTYSGGPCIFKKGQLSISLIKPKSTRPTTKQSTY